MNIRLQIADYRLQITDCRLQIADFARHNLGEGGLQIADITRFDPTTRIQPAL
jgi:hypothetical protein